MTQTGKQRLVAGATIDGRYRIDRVVGRWRIGTAFAVQDLQEEGERTLLTLETHPERVPDYARWVREAVRRAPSLPRDLLSPRAGGVDEGLAYLVLDTIRGTPLLQAVRADGPFDERRSAEVTERLARMLSQAHQAEHFVGGLRPTTVLLDPEGDDPNRPSVLDLGLARGLASFVIDPPAPASAYLAPDARPGGPPTAADDVFAVGALLSFMFTGQKPPAIDPHEGGRVAIPPSWIRKDVPLAAYLDPVVLKAMAPRATDRHPDLEALADALTALHEVFELSPAAREMLGLPTPEPATGFRHDVTSPFLLHEFLGLPAGPRGTEGEVLETLSLDDIEEDD